MGLKGSKASEAGLSEDDVIQLVLDQLKLDPSGIAGQNAIKQKIAMRTGIHLKRYVALVTRFLVLTD